MNKNVLLEIIKWIIIVTLLFISIIGNYLYRDYNIFIRSFLVCVTIVFSLCFALLTKVGKLVIMFGIDAYSELKKVIWPTYRDGLYTTLVVIIVTFLVSLVLWGLDSLLVHIISYGLQL